MKFGLDDFFDLFLAFVAMVGLVLILISLFFLTKHIFIFFKVPIIHFYLLALGILIITIVAARFAYELENP